jgi:hypothetical protein
VEANVNRNNVYLSSFLIIINVIIGDAFLLLVFVNCGVKTGRGDEFVFLRYKIHYCTLLSL